MRGYYAGIGSRETPEDVMGQMTKVAAFLCRKGYWLRSGGAEGADVAFENGVFNDNKQIFLPWPRFNNNGSKFIEPTEAAIKIAKKYHPKWDVLTKRGKLLISRNTHQVLGPDCNNKSEFIICWTKDGLASGGTGQAIRIAKDLLIPVYNMGNSQDKVALSLFLNGIQ